MNGIEKIVARIEGDAAAEADELIAEAEGQLAAIADGYDKQAQDEYWKLVRAGVKDCEARDARVKSAAEMEAKKSILTLKQEMVRFAFERAKDALANLPEREYAAFLTALAVSSSRSGQELIILNPRDLSGTAGKAAVKAANEELPLKRGLPGMLSISGETRDISGGLILKDGDIEINCSVAALTEYYKNGLSAQVAEVLFD
jgi:V/A-type H+-transporting ATPase subunit E